MTYRKRLMARTASEFPDLGLLNPFVVHGLPRGTDSVALRMQDPDAPRHNHGGGKVKMSQSGTVPAGAFTYEDPCPPRAVHR